MDAFDRGYLWAVGDKPFERVNEYEVGTLERAEYLAGVAEFNAQQEQAEAG